MKTWWESWFFAKQKEKGIWKRMFTYDYNHVKYVYWEKPQ